MNTTGHVRRSLPRSVSSAIRRLPPTAIPARKGNARKKAVFGNYLRDGVDVVSVGDKLSKHSLNPIGPDSSAWRLEFCAMPLISGGRGLPKPAAFPRTYRAFGCLPIRDPEQYAAEQAVAYR